MHYIICKTVVPITCLLGLALWQIISATRADPDQDAGRSISPTSTPRAE